MPKRDLHHLSYLIAVSLSPYVFVKRLGIIISRNKESRKPPEVAIRFPKLWRQMKANRTTDAKLVIPLTMKQWHTLQISIHGTNLQASLNGKHLLDYTLAEPVSGKVGV